MPILHVKALPQKDNSKIEMALKKTCIAIAEFYACNPDQVWATWEEIKSGWYVEGNQSANIQPDNTHPPIVTLSCFEGTSKEKIAELLLITSKTLSDELGLKDNMFMTYHEVKSGLVVAGNGVIRKK